MRLPFLLRALLPQTRSPSPPPQDHEPTMATAAASASRVDSMMARVALECGGDISASQEEILANAPFLGGDNGLPASASDEEEEVFATPPDATQQDDDAVIMCTLSFTPTPSETPAPPSDDAEAVLAPPSSKPHSPAPPSSSDDDDAAPVNPSRKPRICTRKVRGARIRTPTPSPEQQQLEQQPEPEQPPPPQPGQPVHADPLVRAVLMIPTRTTTATASSHKQDPVEDFLALARQKGLI